MYAMQNRVSGSDMNGQSSYKNGISLSFHNIRYEVLQKLDDVPVCGKTGMKEILCGVSGLLPPGLNAIMGPTGSGKTSLLDVLAQRKDPTGLKAGYVLLNGEKTPRDFRLMSGYVVQDDIVMGTLTVKENLAFSANLRLPPEQYNAKQRQKKVEDVVEQLGLQACADTMVGNEFIRGVSGGERKRVNVGMEMILDPPVLFLDEPTTGLDANTANSIVLLLYRLASEGRNIIMSIHQPRYSIFSLFDRLVILNKGQIVYRGPAKKAVGYFSDIGYPCPQYHNPADFFLDIVGGDVNTSRLIGRMNQVSESSNEGDDTKRHARANSREIQIAMDEDQLGEKDDRHLAETFSKSRFGLEENDQLAELQKPYEQSLGTSSRMLDMSSYDAQYATGFFHQVQAVVKRTGLNIIRHPMTSFVQIIIMLIFALLIGLIYYQSDTSFKTGLQNRAGVFFFLITTQVMSNLSALEIFIRNRSHFIHESASGYYRVSVYFIAQVFADLVPNRFVPNLFFTVVIYFMVGFQLDVGKYFFFLLTIFLTAVCASTMAFCVSASVRIFAIANVVVSLPYILMMLFGGFLVNIGTLLDWLEWIKYISIFRYGINALTVNEMSGLVFIDNSSYPGFEPDSSNPCLSKITNLPIPNCTTGEAYMEVQGIPYGVWGLWQNILALGCMSIFFLFLSYVQLRRVNKFK
uniref:ATP-binding cassette sub-family G member 2-like n=1 Tax=Phallusia mammillata TaxID=59560 RepID=A0A6F9D6D3_9ASCI|nr:ATP-binding cassette sub-family G member 2-like [Phallusia mammillata]